MSHKFSQEEFESEAEIVRYYLVEEFFMNSNASFTPSRIHFKGLPGKKFRLRFKFDQDNVTLENCG